MKQRIKGILLTLLILTVITWLFIIYAPKYLNIMRMAPRGIHGIYSSADRDSKYQTQLSKDVLLKKLEQDGYLIKGGKLHDYDPPWDSLSYLIDKIPCDTQKIEAYIEFKRANQNELTNFRILWFNATPNLSEDTNVYNNLARRYYRCFEDILKSHMVSKN